MSGATSSKPKKTQAPGAGADYLNVIDRLFRRERSSGGSPEAGERPGTAPTLQPARSRRTVPKKRELTRKPSAWSKLRCPRRSTTCSPAPDRCANVPCTRRHGSTIISPRTHCVRSSWVPRTGLFIGPPQRRPRAAKMFTLAENCRMLGIKSEYTLSTCSPEWRPSASRDRRTDTHPGPSQKRLSLSSSAQYLRSHLFDICGKRTLTL